MASSLEGNLPKALPLPPSLPIARDRPFRGQISLHVDATDTSRGVFHTVETVPVQAPGEVVLLYPKWETTSHSATAWAVELAGLRIAADGRDLAWRRDTVNVHAFHVFSPLGTRSLTIRLDFLPSRSSAMLRPGLLVVPWHRVLVYPAGWYARNQTVAAEVRLPAGLKVFSALQPLQKGVEEGVYAFTPETLDELTDSPLYAAKCSQRYELASGAQAVSLDLLTDSPEKLALGSLALAHMRQMVRQTQQIFGAAPFRHYDMIVTLDDELSPGGPGAPGRGREQSACKLPDSWLSAA